MKTNKISVYDNGGKTFDRYTIVLLETKSKPLFGGKYYDYECIGSSENGTGFFMHSTCQLGRHLGKKIKFESLPKELQERVIDEIYQA